MSEHRANIERELSALNSAGVGVRVRFVWLGDRYGHQIEVVDGSLTRTVLESVEGGEEANWPPSPPLQHVNISWIASDTQHGHVAMLVGGAGNSHWSMCVSVRDGNKDVFNNTSGTELFFDVACRVHDAPGFLGSTYRVPFQQVIVSDRLNCAFVPPDGPGLVVVPQDAQLGVKERHTQSPILRCKATDIRLAELPATLRWRYAIRRSTGGPLRIAVKKRSK
jgi:hypothetical protein